MQSMDLICYVVIPAAIALPVIGAACKSALNSRRKRADGNPGAAAEKGSPEESGKPISKHTAVQRNDQYNTLLIEACEKGDLEKARNAINLGSDVNSLVNDKTALYRAVAGNHLEIVRTLLSCDVDVDKKGDGWTNSTPAKLAVNEGKLEILRLLLEKKAGMKGLLHTACFYGHIEIARLLMEKGADVNEEQHGSTPAKNAVEQGKIEALRLLLEKKVGMKGLLYTACLYGHIDIARLLIEKGADVNEDKGAPIRTAAAHGYAEIVELLLRNGADSTMRDAGKKNAFFYAEDREIKNLLIKYLTPKQEDYLLDCFFNDLSELIKRKKYNPWDDDDEKSQFMVKHVVNYIIALPIPENKSVENRFKEIIQSESWVLKKGFEYCVWDNMGCKSRKALSINRLLEEHDPKLHAYINELALQK